jgi:hypothetical protein
VLERAWRFKSSSGHHLLHSSACNISITAIYRPRFTLPLRLKLGQYTHAELHRAYAAANDKFDLQLKLMDNSLSTPNLPDVILDGSDRYWSDRREQGIKVQSIRREWHETLAAFRLASDRYGSPVDIKIKQRYLLPSIDTPSGVADAAVLLRFTALDQ